MSVYVWKVFSFTCVYIFVIPAFAYIPKAMHHMGGGGDAELLVQYGYCVTVCAFVCMCVCVCVCVHRDYVRYEHSSN